MAVPGLHCWVGFSFVAAVGAALHCSAWASRCAGCFHLQDVGSRARSFSRCGRGLSSCGSQAPGAGPVVVAHRLSYSEACEVFLVQESNLQLLHWQVNSSAEPPQETLFLFFLLRIWCALLPKDSLKKIFFVFYFLE